MKTMNSLFLAFACLFLGSCELFEDESATPSCKDYGYLKVTNDSRNSVHKIVIDGTWYATLGPGDSETLQLAVGRHNVVFQGVTGGGCSPSTVTIVECSTEGRICRN